MQEKETKTKHNLSHSLACGVYFLAPWQQGRWDQEVTVVYLNCAKLQAPPPPISLYFVKKIGNTCSFFKHEQTNTAHKAKTEFVQFNELERQYLVRPPLFFNTA